MINNLLDSSSGGFAGSGAVATLWAASLGVNGLKMGFNQIYGVESSQNFIIQRLLSMLNDLHTHHCDGRHSDCFRIWPPVSEWLIPLLRLNDDWLRTFNTLRWPVTITALLSLLCFKLFSPNVKIRMWTVLPGTAFMVAGWLLVAQAFPYT